MFVQNSPVCAGVGPDRGIASVQPRARVKIGVCSAYRRALDARAGVSARGVVASVGVADAA